MMSNEKMKRSTITKLLVVVVVMLLSGGVFLLKSAQTTPALPVAAPVIVTGSDDLLITSPIDFKALLSSGLPVIIDFGADSCIPCKEMAPVLADLNVSLRGKAIIRFVDVWKYKDLAEGIPIQVIPTQIFFDSKGKPFTPREKSPVSFKIYSDSNSGEHVFTSHEGGLDKPQMLAILKDMGME